MEKQADSERVNVSIGGRCGIDLSVIGAGGPIVMLSFAIDRSLNNRASSAQTG